MCKQSMIRKYIETLILHVDTTMYTFMANKPTPKCPIVHPITIYILNSVSLGALYPFIASRYRSDPKISSTFSNTLPSLLLE